MTPLSLMFSTLFPPVLQTVHSLRQGSNDSTTALMRPEAYFFFVPFGRLFGRPVPGQTGS